MTMYYYLDQDYSKTCTWSDLFNNDERIIVQDGFVVTGILSVMLSSWLTLTLLLTNLRYDNSYRNLANFTLTACFRRIVPVLSHLTFVKYIESWYGFQAFSCDVFAFIETFLAVFEVECLTHVCIERYVVAKYKTNGWQINKSHYSLYPCLCFFFSCVYSIPPLFGIGRYGFDFQCTSCTYEMVLPETWERYIVIIIFMLRSVKPAIVMIMMLIWARVLESKHSCSMKKYNHFTQSVIVIAIVNLICWSPIALIRGWVLLSHAMHLDPLLLTSALYIKWAMWIHWVAPALTTISLFAVDDRVRCKMFDLCNDEENMEPEDDKED